ncbi:unnamed protein product [Prorocentrum cordatum]|uniref:Uncharacterized protein n=1 Tax=Prorocentrum cordatum TaxID=2364126 RepID=A0ABN9XCI9_9DINO|nr:unnamed protein product [Polarella glacialis]
MLCTLQPFRLNQPDGLPGRTVDRERQRFHLRSVPYLVAMVTIISETVGPFGPVKAGEKPTRGHSTLVAEPEGSAGTDQPKALYLCGSDFVHGLCDTGHQDESWKLLLVAFGEGLPAAELAQLSTSKVPPFWAPYLEQRGYPFCLWVQDVMLWCAATELQPPQRGPAIVQRLGGTARDLCRELPVENIALGRFDGHGNQIEDGVQMLTAGLRRRFGPLDVQTSISTIVELITFRRQERESVDDAVTRIEALRARAGQLDDQFVLPTPVLALLFLEAMHVPKAVYPLVLQSNSGQLPTTTDQLNTMIGMVRQQGHFAEHTHAGPQSLAEGYRGKGHHGQHWFTGDGAGGAATWSDTAAYMYGQSAGGGSSTGSARHGNSSQYYVVQDEEGCDCCATCASYLYEDEPGDEDSMTDDDDIDTSEFTPAELQEYYGDAEGWDCDTLLHEYMFAKRRFRHFVHRGSRRARFPRSNWSMRMSSGKGGSFGRGRGHGKGYHFGGSVVNPGSLAGGKGKRKKGGKHYMAGSPRSTNPRGRDGRSTRCHECDSATHFAASCPQRKGKGKGKHFAAWSAPSATTGPPTPGSQAVGPVLAAYSPSPAQPRTGSMTGVLHYLTDDVQTPGVRIGDLDEDDDREALDWETLNMFDDITERDMLAEIQASAEDLTDAKTSLEWFPWWRVDQLESTSEGTYLVRTRMKNKSGEALPVDPGGPGNLIGDEWGHRMAEKQRQAGGQVATYEAPVLPNSSVPELLGRKSLRGQRALLDCFNNRLYRIGPGVQGRQRPCIGYVNRVRYYRLDSSYFTNSDGVQHSKQAEYYRNVIQQRSRREQFWWADSLRHRRPELAWISLAQPGTARGTRNDKRAKRFECRIARAQLEGHRLCVVEADEGSAAWDMPDILELIDDGRWHMGRLRWCNLGVRDARGFPAAQVTRIFSSSYFDDHDAKCRCGWPPGRHVTRKTAADRPDFKAKGVSALVKRMVAAGCIDGGVRSRTVALEEAGVEQSRRELHPPGRVSFADDVDDAGCKVSALAASFPTEQRTRDKARKAADPDRKVKKRPQEVEQVFDDCGSDFTKLYVANEYEVDEVCYGAELREDQYVDGFSVLNKVINHGGWLRSRRISVALARLAAAAACAQMNAGRHFVSEQPLGSDFTNSTTGLPIKKSSEFWASNECLIGGLRKFRCDGQHQHALLAHGGRGACPEQDKRRLENPKDHAEWAIGICRELATSIARMIEHVRSQGHHLVVFECYPATAVQADGAGQSDRESCGHGNRQPRKSRLRINHQAQLELTRPTPSQNHHYLHPFRQNGELEERDPMIHFHQLWQRGKLGELAWMVHDLDRDWQPHWTEQSQLSRQVTPQDLLTPPRKHRARRNLQQLQLNDLKVSMRELRLEPVTSLAGPRSTSDTRCDCRAAHIKKLSGANYDDSMFAGALASTLALVKEICDTCRVCRMWTRPGPKSMTVSRLATGFNEMVQWDILYIGDQMVAHMIDEATRWTVLNILDRKAAITIIAGITNGWIRPRGPMKLLIADVEGGLHGEEAYQWLDRWDIEIKAKEEGSHAQLVERHHDLARKIIHRVRSQLEQEGIAMPLEIVIAECALIKNLLITVAGFSPYQAVYGRLPPLLAEFEPVSHCQIDDQSAGIPGISRHRHRLREVAMQAMVEMTAKDRLRRALRSKTRAPHETVSLAVGDQVDFHRPPSTKEESGWRGPATLLQVGPPVLVRWQGRVFQVRPQDLRRSLVYIVMFTNNIFFEAGSRDPVATIMSYADQLDSKVARVGWLFDAGWKRTADSQKLSELVLAVLHVAASGFYLVGCIDARVGNGVSVFEGMVGCDHSFLWWWRRGRPELSWYHEASGSARLKLAQIFGKDHWRDVSFVQFILTDHGLAISHTRDDMNSQSDLNPDHFKTHLSFRKFERDRDLVTLGAAIVELEEDHDANDDDDSDSDATQEYEFASWQYMKEQAALPAVDIECAQNDFFFSAPDADHVMEAIEEDSTNSRPDCVEIGMGAPLMYWVCPEAEHVRRPGTGEIYVLRIYSAGQREIVVEREMNVLTLEEAREHGVEVRQAMKDELQRWAGLQAFQRFPKDQANNVIDLALGVMLKKVLEKTGGKALISDPQLYVYHNEQGELQMIMSSHVDDLKGGGEDYLREKVLGMIEAEFGKLKRQYGNFECIGIMREQNLTTKAIWTHKQHYAQQLRPLQEYQHVMENDDGQVNTDSHAA